MSHKRVNDDVARAPRKPERRLVSWLRIALWVFITGLAVAFVWLAAKLALSFAF